MFVMSVKLWPGKRFRYIELMDRAELVCIVDFMSGFREAFRTTEEPLRAPAIFRRISASRSGLRR